MYVGFILGPAGSGKSFITGSLAHWMSSMDLDVATLNLDPAVRRLSYSPDIDIRDFVNIDNLIDEVQLGPNGALIAAMDHAVAVISELMDEVHMVGPEMLLVDTPGQMEIFAYRSSGQILTEVISQDRTPGSIFLIDPTLATTPSNYISLILLSLSIAYRLNLPLQNVISKADLLQEEHRNTIDSWVEDPFKLEQDLFLEKAGPMADLGSSLLTVLREKGVLGEIPFVSADTNENMDVVLGMLQRMWAIDDEVNP